jgi:hypothetical protein
MKRATNISLACEACRFRPITQTIVNAVPDEPYQLCDACSGRLHQRALRPLESFNLAALHGWVGLLHDDYYDQDGVASDPEVNDYSIDGLVAPTFDEASQTLDRLIDYCITRWRRLDAQIYDAFKSFSSEDILREIDRRAQSRNASVFSVMLQLCANVLRDAADAWVREQYARAVSDDALSDWAEAAANCLPRAEGLEKTLAALQEHSGLQLRQSMFGLRWFRSPTVLDWIEINAPRQNVPSDWGDLASWSDLSWSRIDKWLSSGRPLSLVALDALAACIRRGREPGLKGLPDRPTITAALEGYLTADNAPRVEKNCRYILENLDQVRVE